MRNLTVKFAKSQRGAQLRTFDKTMQRLRLLLILEFMVQIIHSVLSMASQNGTYMHLVALTIRFEYVHRRGNNSLYAISILDCWDMLLGQSYVQSRCY